MKKAITSAKRMMLGELKGLRAEDVLLASFPKSGNTYVRFVLANIISLTDRDGETIDFQNLHTIMPEIGKHDLRETWPHAVLPRVVKTHDRYSRIYADADRVLYVVRDPRDVLLSYYNYLSFRKGGPRFDSIMDLASDPDEGIPAMNAHLDSWSERDPLMVSYTDLMTAPVPTFSRILEAWASPVDDSVLEEAIERSSPENMRKLEEARSRPGVEKNFKPGHRFVRKASVEQWRTDLDPEVCALVGRLASPVFAELGFDLGEMPSS